MVDQGRELALIEVGAGLGVSLSLSVSQSMTRGLFFVLLCSHRHIWSMRHHPADDKDSQLVSLKLAPCGHVSKFGVTADARLH